MDESRFNERSDVSVDMDTFAQNVEQIRHRLYKTALLYTGDPSTAVEVLDETVYKALKACGKLQQEEFFTTWITRILLNECSSERKRRGRMAPLETLPETAVEQFDALPLKEAIRRLPPELKQVLIPRYFAGYTLRETADILQLPLGTVATRQRRALTLLRLDLSEEGSYGS